jgi:hypothetical protein
MIMGEKKNTPSILMPLAMAVSSLLAIPFAGQLSEGTESRLQQAKVVAQVETTAAPQAMLTPSSELAMRASQQEHSSHSSHASHRSHRSSAL